MPDTPRTAGDAFSFRNSTLRDVLAAHREKIAELEAEFGEDTPGVLIARAGTILLEKWAEDELGESILDALIGCQGKVVYTAKDVERVAKVHYEAVAKKYGGELGWEYVNTSERLREQRDWLLETARAALTAAGGVVADEVMTQAVDMVDGDNGSVRWLNSTGPNEEWSFLDLRPGDKLYIVRAKEE